jgi:hypothetical protein
MSAGFKKASVVGCLLLINAALVFAALRAKVDAQIKDYSSLRDGMSKTDVHRILAKYPQTKSIARFPPGAETSETYRLRGGIVASGFVLDGAIDVYYDKDERVIGKRIFSADPIVRRVSIVEFVYASLPVAALTLALCGFVFWLIKLQKQTLSSFLRHLILTGIIFSAMLLLGIEIYLVSCITKWR